MPNSVAIFFTHIDFVAAGQEFVVVCQEGPNHIAGVGVARLDEEAIKFPLGGHGCEGHFDGLAPLHPSPPRGEREGGLRCLDAGPVVGDHVVARRLRGPAGKAMGP